MIALFSTNRGSRKGNASIVARNDKRPLTVLQVLPHLDMGGVARGTLEIARAITDAGGRALVASAGGNLEARLKGYGGTAVRMPLASRNPVVIAANAARLSRLIAQESVDVVNVRARAPAWSAWLASRRTGAALITTWHEIYPERNLSLRLYTSVMARGRPVIAVSEFVAATIARRYPSAAGAIEIIPRGADMEIFAEEVVGAERTIALARNWGLVEDPRPVVMLPGALTRWKGQSVFIEAAAHVRKLRRGAADFLFVIVGEEGEPGMTERLLARAAAADALEIVRIVGPCEDMPAAYKLASVVVSASTRPEAFGRVAVEAQAMGRPVIATDHGGARETVAQGRTGWLIPPGDPEALGNAIHTALTLDPSARAHLGMAGRARVRQLFTIEAMQRATLAAYERAAGRAFGAEASE
jgi:glycosyltransferase involved in cell wall biosynthesis